jgi:L-iditol 2-dehydrogenase
MKALVLKEYGRFEYADVPDPAAGPGEVLVRVRACGICGSDVHGMDGSSGRRIPPVIMGHEASGEIMAVGPGVERFGAGDRVTFDSTVFCGECEFCRAGEINLCDSRQVLGVSCEDYRRDGAMAELVAVPDRLLYALPDEVSLEQAAMVEPVAVALHAVRLTKLRPDDTVVVIGAGMIGLLVIQVLRAEGWWKIAAVDVDPGRLEMAAHFGAETTISAREQDAAETVLGLTDGRGADAAFEVVGITETVDAACRCLRKGGALTLVGNVSASVEFPLQWVVTRQISAQGSCASAGEYGPCLDFIASGAVDADPLISGVVPLAEGEAWFRRLKGGEPGLMKVILVP